LTSAALWPWGRLSLWKKWVPGIFSEEERRSVCVGLTNLSLSCADFLQIWVSETPGPLRACLDQYWHCFTSFLPLI
jgi:hypothetical protein